MDEQTVSDCQVALAETYGGGPRDAVAPGVVVVDGYGMVLAVEKGALRVLDGLGRHRRERSFARTAGLRRVAILGNTGTISLAALKWLADVGASMVVVETDGRVLVTSAGPGRDDARLRRSQAAAYGGAVGLRIAVYLLGLKLAGQEAVASEVLHNVAVADTIESLAGLLDDALTVDDARLLEAQAAAAYWSGWVGPGLRFTRKDETRVPDRWKRHRGRVSPLTQTNRKASDPINAMLSYCYALAESECRLACLVAGLDPGLGVLHLDEQGRDSLALDVLESVRPHVDRFVLGLVQRHTFSKRDFVELPDGAVRVLAPLTHELAASMPAFAQAAAPVAHHVAAIFASTATGKVRPPALPGFRRPQPLPLRLPTLAARCHGCGLELETSRRPWCPACFAIESPARAAKSGRPPSRAATGRWTAAAFAATVMPKLPALSIAEITAAASVARSTASRWRNGRTPHPQHWRALAELAEVSPPAPPVVTPLSVGSP